MKPNRHLSGGVQCQPGLAHPAHTGQGHYPRLLDCGHRLLQLAAAADERAHLQRQIAGALSNRAERREIGWQLGMGELVDHFWAGQITQPELTQLLQPEPATQIARNQVACGLGEEHLPAVAGGPHPGTTVDRRVVDMITAAHPRFPGVQPHPYPQPGTRGPYLTTEPKLTHPGRLNRRNRARKDGKETVTLPAGGDHRPAMPLDHRCKEAIMPLQRHLHRLRLNLPPPGGTLDVSQQESNRPGRQLRYVGLARPGRRWTRGTNIDRPSRKALTSQDKPGFRVFSCPSLPLNSAPREESSGTASPNDPDRPHHAADFRSARCLAAYA